MAPPKSEMLLLIEDPAGTSISLIEDGEQFATLSVVDAETVGASFALTPEMADKVADKLKEWASAARKRAS